VDHVLHQLVGRQKPERGRVADVELGDPLPFLFHLFGARQHRPANVVADVGQLGRFHDGLHRI